MLATDPDVKPKTRGLPCAPSSSAKAKDRQVSRRLQVVQFALLSGLAGLGGALGYWQLSSRSDELTALQRRQSVRHVWIPGKRGSLLDREGRIIARDRIQLDATLNLTRLRETAIAENVVFDRPMRNRLANEAQEALRHLVPRTRPFDSDDLERHLARKRGEPYVLLADLSGDEAEQVRKGLRNDAAIDLVQSFRREYPNGSIAAHAIGRVKRTEHVTRGQDGSRFLAANDYTGDSGAEKQFDDILRAVPGTAHTLYDVDGYSVGALNQSAAPIPGSDVVLSLDLDLQKAAENAMEETSGKPRGAAVAVSVATGEVLALASKPDFDLGAVSPSISSALKTRLDADGAWLNRPVQALYPPGSTFKVFTALAALRAGTLDPGTTYSCSGHLMVQGRRFSCHLADGHGRLTLNGFLARSCNVYAYQTGLAAGPLALASELRRFHFHEASGIDLPYEALQMLVPSPQWKHESFGEAWTAGDTINVAIGQGFVRVTPLQAACAIASLARRETLTVPTILRSPGRNPAGHHRENEALQLSDTHYQAIVEAMRHVVDLGIGRDAQVPGVAVAGKTGTAQVEHKDGMRNVAWFLAFAPADKPEIAVAVAMEGTEPNVEFAGAEHAAPIVREILGAYFDKKR